MDAVTKERTRNSRWDREPVLGPDGEPKVARLTDRDIEIFKLLARYTYLPLDDIHAFVGGSLKGLSQHINILCRKPNLFLKRPAQQRDSADANHRRLVYQLDDKAIAYLRERGVAHVERRYHRNFRHELMACQIMASLEIGVRKTGGVRLITWPEILASDRTPDRLRQIERPESIPVSLELKGDRRKFEIRADSYPFGLERTTATGRTYLFFPGIEADCGTEPIEASDLERTSIHRKFIAYRAVAEQGLYRSHFGFPNLFVPIVTTTHVRMQSMMAALDRATHGSGSRMFLFKTFQSAAERSGVCEPGHMLAEPWQRVGFPPLSLAP